MNALARLFTSTVALYSRFNLDARSTPPDKRRKFLMEEVGELVADSATYERAHIPDEAADVIVTVLGLCQSHGITLAEIEAACERVAAKNDAKTVENGYALVGGKISQQQAVQP